MNARELMTAASRIDPLGVASAWSPRDEAEVRDVVEILRVNKVPLTDLDPASGPATESDCWNESLERETGERARLLEEYRQVESLLRAKGIEPVLFKSAGGFPYRSSNLDVLVPPESMDRAAGLLTEAGHLRFPHYREEHKLLFRKFEEGRSRICVHLHETVSWGRVLILAGEDVCGESRAKEACRIASPVHLAIATLAHMLYETDQIRLSDLRTLRICSAEPLMDWNAALDEVRRRHWEIGFHVIVVIVAALEKVLFDSSGFPRHVVEQARDAVGLSAWAGRYPSRLTARLERRGPGTMPMPLSRVHSKAHYLRQLLVVPERSPDEKATDVIATAWNLLANRMGLRCRPAVVVSLSGLDGAGKSTAIDAVEEAMRLCEIPVRVVWSRGGFTGWIERLKRTSRRALPGYVPQAGDPEAKRRWLSAGVGGAIFSLLVAAEQAMHYQIRVRLPRWLGLSILCDRYTFDTMVDLESKLGKSRAAARVAAGVIRRVAPRPDLAVYLRLGAGEARRRKPEDAPAGTLETRRILMDSVANGENMLVIDAAAPAREVAGRTVEAALRSAFTRFAERDRGGRP